jgi:hypothetical protein
VSQTSHDARAVVRAIDALTEEVRRLADAQPTPPPMDPVHILGIEAEGPSCSSVPACDGQCCKQAPAVGEDAQRTTRRDSAHNLLARLDRGGLLSPADCALLRQHFDAETREHDTARAVAAGNLRHVKTLIPEIDRLAAELEEAQAAAERVRRVAALIEAGAPWTANQQETARRILTALDGTEQPTTEA